MLRLFLHPLKCSIRRAAATAFAALAGLTLAACDRAGDDGVVDVAIIGSDQGMRTPGLRLSYAAQHLRAATAQGLVRLDATGLVVPGIAERWIVTDDGSSYIFRIREFDLPGGGRLTAQAVRDSLRRTMARLEGTSLGLDLERVRDIRAMTGRVVEIRLDGPMPELLQLLAQPELGLAVGDAPLGPMQIVSPDAETEALEGTYIAAMAPELRGLPSQPEWDEGVQPVRLVATDARAAVEGFSRGAYDVVLGGSIVDFPLAETGPLSRGTIRLDAAAGLFGLDIRTRSGFLAEADNREALIMAIDRPGLIQAFGVGGWTPSERIVPPILPTEIAAAAAIVDAGTPSWSTLDLEQRRAEASARVAAYVAATGGEPISLRIGMPQGPGADLLFAGIETQFAAIGVAVTQVGMDEAPDLALRERTARYGGSQWFLNQFDCAVSRAVCSEDVDFLLDLARDAPTPAQQVAYLVEAEAALVALSVYIPFGPPIRWSMVRGDVAGFAENPWGLHPLFPLSGAPI
ncbi:MAG: peptide ABC transporter substrate-binding protein [Erythrobacter sp.]|nr:peptide ABC transporter substrate-binding protein [Erythrobacter sp.]